MSSVRVNVSTIHDSLPSQGCRPFRITLKFLPSLAPVFAEEDAGAFSLWSLDSRCSNSPYPVKVNEDSCFSILHSSDVASIVERLHLFINFKISRASTVMPPNASSSSLCSSLISSITTMYHFPGIFMGAFSLGAKPS